MFRRKPVIFDIEKDKELLKYVEENIGNGKFASYVRELIRQDMLQKQNASLDIIKFISESLVTGIAINSGKIDISQLTSYNIPKINNVVVEKEPENKITEEDLGALGKLLDDD